MEELPAPIKGPAEDIRQLLLEHPYLQQAIKGGRQSFDNHRVQVFRTYLSHVSKVVKHILLHPKGEPEANNSPAAAEALPPKTDAGDADSPDEILARLANPSVAGPVPPGFEALEPSLKLLVILFNLPVEFTTEYRIDYEGCRESGLTLSPASTDALVPLRLADGQAQTLRWFACMATH